MDWTAWIIPLIAIAVWVISSIAKNQQEQRRPDRPTPGRPPARPEPAEAAGPKPQRTSAEIEDFLREVRRRREASEQKKEKKVTVSTPPPRPVVRPPEPVRSRPSLEAPIPMAIPTLPDRPAPPQATPATPRRQNQPAVEEVVVAQVVSAASAAAPRRVVVPVPSVRLGVASGAGGQFLQLLRNPQSMKTAIMLREILDKPISRRRRG